MPQASSSSYPGPPWYQYNADIQTIWPGVFRRISGVQYERERLELSDGDFVDLDWLDKGSRRLVLLTHGLEGNSERHYVKGMAKIFARQGWDALAWNCRSCSGEMNRKVRLYNHGEIEDIGEVIAHALKTKDYEQIVLIGLSMGGNISLKYLSVNAQTKPDCIKACIAISAPVDLGSSAAKLDLPEVAFYRKRFFKMLEAKMIIKAKQFPGIIDLENLKKIKCWEDFDNYFSAPINGYKNAQDFYYQASAINYMSELNVPSLLLNALNDPILTESCFPRTFAKNHQHLFLETPKLGGHVGFCLPWTSESWAERRSLEFVENLG